MEVSFNCFEFAIVLQFFRHLTSMQVLSRSDMHVVSIKLFNGLRNEDKSCTCTAIYCVKVTLKFNIQQLISKNKSIFEKKVVDGDLDEKNEANLRNKIRDSSVLE